MLNSNLFEVTRDGERWMCRPSMLIAQLGFGLGAGMSALLIYLAWKFWRNGQSEETDWFAGIMLLIAMFVAALATWRLWAGRTPLIIERSGRVSYSEKELCAAGQVRTVRLIASGGEDEYDVCLELEGGARVVVPGFAYGPRESALAFAQEVGTELGVPVA